MRKTFTMVGGLTVAIVLLSLVCGCKGPAGPAGVDGTAACAVCHSDSTAVLARIIQWENSVHATGGNFERNSTSCAPCHTSEGFVEVLATGAETTATDITNPTPISCRTCHNIHMAFTWNDFDLRTTAAVTFKIDGGTFNMGDGNLCANCHQARTVSPMPVVGGDSVAFTTSRYGPHHGPQSNILAGSGGYEIPGNLSYGNSAHTALVTNGCPTCHMADPYGNQAGGHTMGLEYEYHGSPSDYTEGCNGTSCHDDLSDFDHNGVQTTIEGLLTQLEAALIAEGILTAGGSSVGGTWSSIQVGALLNYKFVLEDRSLGVHNSDYSEALLQNALDAL